MNPSPHPPQRSVPQASSPPETGFQGTSEVFHSAARDTGFGTGHIRESDHSTEHDAMIAHLVTGLTKTQREAVLTNAPYLCILAGAGSGKTRVLTRRIARRVFDGSAAPAATLAVTFTRKAATEMQTRLRRLGIEGIRCGTFHSIAYAMLRRQWEVNGEWSRSVLEYKTGLVSWAIKQTGTRPTPPLIKETASEIERSKSRSISHLTYAAHARQAGQKTTTLSPEHIARIYYLYETEKRRSGKIDLEDMIVQLKQVLQTDKGFAHVVRRATRHIYVDEFQDVNASQFSLLWLWTRTHDTDATPADLCVVGDDDQAIYSFRGADPRYLTSFTQKWPGAQCVLLKENFRCSPQILHVANRVLAEGGRSQEKEQHPTREDGPAPLSVGHISAEEEAKWAASVLREQWHLGRRWSDMAVLIRTHVQSASFERAFTTARIPFTTTGGGAFLALPEIHAVLNHMHDSPLPPGQPLASFTADIAAEIAESFAPPKIGINTSNSRENKNKLANLATLVQLAEEHGKMRSIISFERPDCTTNQISANEKSRTDLVADFIAYVKTEVSGDPRPGTRPDAVSILTIHRAKGLEFDTVIVAGLEEGLIPIWHATTPAGREEERRLFYVAMTRAKRQLCLSWSERRATDKKGAPPRRPSAFWHTTEKAIQELSTIDTHNAQDKTSATRRAKESMAILTSMAAAPRVAPEYVPLYQALHAWRATQSQTDNVRPSQILPEYILQRLAIACPQTHADLARLLDTVKFHRHGNDILRLCTESAPKHHEKNEHESEHESGETKTLESVLHSNTAGGNKKITRGEAPKTDSSEPHMTKEIMNHSENAS